MIIDPPIEKMSEKVGNKYVLCVLASKRALQLQKEHIENLENPKTPELTEAANEIWAGDIQVDDGKEAITTVKVANNN